MKEKGAVLISTFIIMVALIAIGTVFLYMVSAQTKGIGSVPTSKAVWLAEAGIQKTIWNLKTPSGSGGQGENWTTTGTTENLGDGSYTIVVARWDFALAANGSIASDSPAQTSSSLLPSKAIDGNDSTYWQSLNRPTNSNPQSITIAFPYTLTLNKVRFLSPDAGSRPREYTWQTSSDGSTYTTVYTGNTGNQASLTDVTNTFTAASGVNYLRLRITRCQAGASSTRARIATLEAIGSKITSTGTVATLNRTLEQTVVADDATQTALDQIDWNET